MLLFFGSSQSNEEFQNDNDIEKMLLQNFLNGVDLVKKRNLKFDNQLQNFASVIPIATSTTIPFYSMSYQLLKKVRKIPPIPILVMACNRITIKRTLDQIFQYRTTKSFPVIVSQDCADDATSKIIKSYEDKITFIQQPDQSDFDLSTKLKVQKGYYKIARHYKWALDQVFYRFNYSVVLIVEDDLDLSPDFFEYFSATYSVLLADPTLWCVSAWNDNGKQHMVDTNQPELLYRTDFFPGLGWMILKPIWDELSPKWPIRYWDDWMRHPDQRKNRACIRPEIPRTSTFGRIGVSKGQYFDKHLQFIKHNSKFIPFSKYDLSYLIKEYYDSDFRNKIYSLPEATAESLIYNTVSIFSNSTPIRVEYADRTNFVRIAKALEIMEDVKFGVPRSGYMGIVSFIFRGQRVYFSPPSNWPGYDESWL